MSQPQMSPEYLAQSQQTTLKAVMWIVSLIPLVVVCLRLYVRVFMKRVFGWDDFIVVIATGLLIAYAAVCHAAADAGLGRHIAYVAQNPKNVTQVALLCDIGESLAIMACSLGKTSFAVTLLRIVVKRWMVALLLFIIITMNIVTILAALFVFVQCEDPRHLWDPSTPSKCWPTDVWTNYALFVGAYSGLQDFILALMPWTIVWKLQMKKKEKFGVAIAMSMGVFAGAASIVKTTYLVSLSAKADFTWELTRLLIWAAVEDGLAITAASIPALKPILTMMSSTPGSGDSYNIITYYHHGSKQKVFAPPCGKTETDIIVTKTCEAEEDARSIRALSDEEQAATNTTGIMVTTSVKQC
ncbi:hypothetical protein ASPWEDRAFT_25609 [Aspergillus wentii DTO 134E9]|uniref:Rhodopsin domain-containing protein n=1 Tax=Aspergillus wentii DTO 134E9 TaxID=1073089 RepID=A0A1L9RY26_ASPWE|nr:uncharacterized protein ASPWEDRAFT_25609 [Aspergillus wentii DTO 134E9]KAI9931517.1 hypothetical protein MW887_010094 [Aspergillus wentii]OJJ39812.1 hypothetical protein ASPWEDRAFT_25609 [Aspergillus wentii DTO 134E9]